MEFLDRTSSPTLKDGIVETREYGCHVAKCLGIKYCNCFSLTRRSPNFPWAACSPEDRADEHQRKDRKGVGVDEMPLEMTIPLASWLR